MKFSVLLSVRPTPVRTFSALLSGICLLLLAVGCAPFSKRFVHDLDHRPAAVPPRPDYGNPSAWASLPERTSDASDVLPKGLAYFDVAGEAPAGAEVFFIHPTIYTNDPAGRYPWNADLLDKALNQQVDASTMRMQASVFNGAGEVYAPRYRQAHISAYYTADREKAQAAFDTAYVDVRAAFLVFLKRRRPDRPIVIAGHSQGTTHGKRLVREFFDGTPLADSLVAAYLIGIPVEADYFTTLRACSQAEETGCIVSWRTWQRPATPWEKQSAFAKTPPVPPYPIVVNPLTWRTDTVYAPAELNPGGTLRKLSLKKHLSDAQVHRGILWINRPHFVGRRILRMENWHAGDINLFYASVYQNARVRTAAWHQDQREVTSLR